MAERQFTRHVGEKFYEDGSVKPFAGVTIICFADPNSAIYQAGEKVQQQLLAQPFGDKFALLPPSSFHMTVMQLLNDADRFVPLWTPHLPLDAPLNTIDEFFIERVGQVTPPQNLRMCMTYLRGRGLSFTLYPADEASYVAVWEYRNAIADATGVRFPLHDSYQFHLTLAYNLVVLDDAEEAAFTAWRDKLGDELRCEIGVFDTGMPTLTFFDDMFAFVPAEERHTLVSRR